MNTSTYQANRLLDVLKYISAILILASHCLPLIPDNRLNFLYGQWFFRFCVPLFFISSGYYFASFSQQKRTEYIRRIVVLYIVSSLIYLPVYLELDSKLIIKNMVYGYHHLWYLSALAISLCIWCFVESFSVLKSLFSKLYVIAIPILILVGAYYDEYQNVLGRFINASLLDRIGVFINFFGGPRHALFFSLPMLLIGKILFEFKGISKLSPRICAVLVMVSSGLSLVECLVLWHLSGDSITCDVTLFNYLPAVFLVILSFKWHPKILCNIATRNLRKQSDVIYICHILIQIAVDRLLNVSYLSRFFCVLVISILCSIVLSKFSIRKKNDRECHVKLPVTDDIWHQL